MNELIERAARALCAPHDPDMLVTLGPPPILPGPVPVNGLIGPARPYWHVFVSQVRAALSAIREPTGEMVDAGWSGLDIRAPSPSMVGAWQAMIDAALTPAADTPPAARTDRPAEP